MHRATLGAGPGLYSQSPPGQPPGQRSRGLAIWRRCRQSKKLLGTVNLGPSNGWAGLEKRCFSDCRPGAKYLAKKKGPTPFLDFNLGKVFKKNQKPQEGNFFRQFWQLSNALSIRTRWLCYQRCKKKKHLKSRLCTETSDLASEPSVEETSQGHHLCALM